MNEKDNIKKSIIDRVLEEKRKKQEEQDRESQEQTVFDQRMQVELTTYINHIIKKVEQNKPFFTPRGRYIGDTKWNISRLHDGVEAVAKEKLTIKLLVFSAEYMKHVDLDIIKGKISETSQQINSSVFNLSVFTCFIVDACVDERVKKMVTTFDHYGFFPMLYSLNEQKLWYNPSEELISYFITWFDPQKNPKQIKDILCSITDKHNVITIDSIKQKFIFDEKESKKMVTSLEKKGIIYHLKGSEYGVNNCQ